MTDKPRPKIPKFAVRITMQVILDSSSKFEKSLTELYRKQQNNSAVSRQKKRFTSKLLVDDKGLVLQQGSWWPGEHNESQISYLQIQQYGICEERPHKLIMIIKSKDGLKSEIILIKTQGQHFASQVIEMLDLYTKVSRAREIYTESSVSNMNQNMREHKPFAILNKKIIIPNGAATTKFEKSFANKKKFSPEYRTWNGETKRATSSPVSGKKLDNIHIITQDKGSCSKNVEEAKFAKRMYLRQSENFIENASTPNKTTYSTSKPKQFAPRNTISSVTHYGRHESKSFIKTEEKREKSKPRKKTVDNESHMTTLTSTEFDKCNSPWEVNICYINEDSAGCFEDSEGPIYMYSAHQLVPRCTAPGFASDFNMDRFSSEEDSLSSSSDSLENLNELDEFILLSRGSNTKKISKKISTIH